MATTIGGITLTVTALAGTELLEFEQSGQSKKGTVQQIVDMVTVAIQEAGVAVGSAKTVNFTGNVDVSAAGNVLTVNIPTPANTGVAVQDEGLQVDAQAALINFVGAGVTVTQTAAGQVQVSIPGGGTGGGSLAVQDEGSAVDSATVLLNFVGNVQVTQTAAGQVQVSIPAPVFHYDLGFFVPGLPTANAVAFRHTFVRNVNFAANFAASDGDAMVAATGSAQFTLKKISGGVSSNVGTVTFTGATPAFASTGGAAVSFAAGDIFELVTPTSQDATLAGVSLTLSGTRA